jgi:EAL domain-containing protein (putative c-di-GMP-specific phosphodiesterase class I)
VRASAAEIRGALGRGELVFHYQPKVSFLSGLVSGAEALIRWRRPDGSVALPETFIPVAEQEGLIPAITEAMFPRLLEDFRRVRAAGHDVSVALNVTAQDLDTPRLLELVRAAIGRGAIGGEHLELEITESAVVSGSDTTRASLAALIEAGVPLAMDDFGTGFSSLAHLRELPLDALKVDKSFVARLGDSGRDNAIVRSTVNLAHDLGLKVVAEGVETAALVERVRELGCDEAQGFAVLRPAPGDEVGAWLAAH